MLMLRSMRKAALSAGALVACTTLVVESATANDAVQVLPEPIVSFLAAHSISFVSVDPASYPTPSSPALASATVNPVQTENVERQLCPALCTETGPDPSAWTVYHDTDRLALCNATMLLDFALYNPLNSTDNHITIRACLANDNEAALVARDEASSSCPPDTRNYTSTSSMVQFARDGFSPDASREEVVAAVQQLTTHLSGRQAVCDKETLAFGYSGQAVVGLYAGPALQKQRIPKQALEQLQVTMQSGNELSDEMYFQLCAPEQLSSRYAMGIAISTKGDLNVVQAAAQTWKNGSCISTYDQISDWLEFQYSIPTASTRNSTVRRSHLSRETTCSTTQAWPGDTHDSLAAECGITTAEFTQYNPSKSLHSSFEAGEHVCCSTGRLANVSPSPYSNGTCATYIVQMGDTCSDLAAANGITIELIEGYNKETWAWLGCGDLQAGKSMCLSTGNPPMPAPIANAVCGPQVPGTPVAPYGTDLTKLNACPLSACCNFWGQCGITDDFCTKTDSPTGAPGTSNCISYCGNEIMFGPPPGEFLKIAYFEGYDVSRPCLRMAVTNIDTSAYTHIHMSFATLNEDFSVDISSIEEQFRLFVQMTGIKRIISFGGWEFSTSAASYMIFRDAVNAANRQTFVDSVISFLNEYDLDGVDFDWEYPGAPDIPDIPASTEEDANNFFLFLNLLSTNMSKNAPGKTLAVTAPSSYWYLKTMPIIPISVVVDYIVYMTYDLHGQWDYDNAWADSGCSAGNCLRSHVNLTETLNAMSMITKAGIPSNKVIIGVSSYGRSFQMTTPGCYGPMCTYTGPESGARKGACTGTAGYLADGEIEQVLRANSSVSVHELDDSFSNILVYDETQWVAYMDADNKGTRTALYAMYNFGGIADWAVDLQSSSGSGGDNDDDSSSSGDGETGEEIYIDPGLWTSSDPVIVCSPPCTFVLPPVPLETTTSITWTSYTTSFQSSKSGTIHTVTSTYSLPPFPVSSISLWPVTVKEGDPKTAPVIPMPSINPPPLVVPLPPGVQPFPPAHFPSANPDVTTTKPTTKPTSTATTTTGDHSNSGSSSSTSRPIYFPTTSHSVTLRPQPTISISWPPPITIPTATYSSGSIARPTNTPGCKGCGAIECIFFGCGGGCGLLACDGGCGVFGCGGGCGLGDCPGNCPLERCGGGGCRDGSCGNSGCADGNCGPSTCETTLTATNCIEYCTVITAAAGAIPTTDCTSTTCFPTTGCQATDTTETITSTSDDACPSPTPITTYPLSEDPYGGCQPCSAAYINWGDPEMEVANDMLRIRGLMGPVGDRRQLEKRATAETFATVATNCALPTPVTMAEYTNVVDYLATAIAGNLPASQDMSRWYSKTVQDCVPTVTTVSDAAIQKNQKDTNQKGTMEHVYEKNWLKEFWNWLMEPAGTGGGGWTCKQFTDLFFPCDANELQSVYDGIAGNKHWDFIGITAELNKQMKGSMGGDYGAEVVRRGKNVRKSIPPQAPWSSHMKILSKEENVLQAFVLGCDIWTSNYIHGPLDATNNRIYNAIYSINQDLAAKYRQWMIETRLGQMMEVTKIQVGELIKDFSAGIEAAKLAAENAGMIGKWEDYGKTLQGLIDTYDLNGSNNPCAKSIELSWALDAATKKRAATALMAQVDENGCPIRPPNTLSIMFKVVETDLPGDWVEFSGYWVVYETTYDHGYNPAVICEEEGLVYGPEFYYWDVEDPQYPTSLGPFDLIQEPYTDCYYKGPATDKLGSVTCSGGVSFSCVSRLVYNQGDGASTECGDVKLYAQIECPIESA